MNIEYGYTIGMLTCYIDKDNMQDLVYNASYNYWAKTPTTNPEQATTQPCIIIIPRKENSGTHR